MLILPGAATIVKAFKREFVGDAHNLLKDAVVDMLQTAGAYANFSSVIQGSGTGKSRTVDKLAETVFTIPILLRNLDDSTGYPAGDKEVVRFLGVKYDEFREEVLTRYKRFLVAILEQALAWIEEWDRDNDDSSHEAIPAVWRSHLQDASERAKLFDVAILKAEEETLNANSLPTRVTFGRIEVAMTNRLYILRLLRLPFDIWKEPIIAKEGEHSADEICRPEFMARFGRPLFWSLLEAGRLASDVLDLAMHKLQLLPEGAPSDEVKRSGKIPEVQLQNALAPLALRIDLTFESNRDEAARLEGLLVASSMRTVYSIPDHREYLRSGYPSERFLAEAASHKSYMMLRRIAKSKSIDVSEYYKEEIPEVIADWFEAGLITKDQRGELVARILLTLAHDLCAIDNSRPLPVLHQTGDNTIVTDETALYAFIRGAFIQGGDYLAAMDIIIPILMKDEKLDRWIMSGIFIQIKNRLHSRPVHIDVEKDFEFFSPHADGKTDSRPYITIVMELGVRKAPGSSGTYTSKGPASGKAGEKAPGNTSKASASGKASKVPATTRGKKAPVPATPKKATSVKVPPTPATVKFSQPERYPSARNKQDKDQHPRYAIKISGCSPAVYNVIKNRTAYKKLLAHTKLFAEHPRKEEKYHNAIKRMKPFWAEGEASYGWAQSSAPSRVGATCRVTGEGVYSDDEISDAGDDDVDVDEWEEETEVDAGEVAGKDVF
ncbi:hypothetical protein DXG03_005954 [Asterophora parasitica]|uniref:Uncharacterized protein n=1 Tax=Asterophora parasitica TaxID=117018 RepID=A0A9P7K7C0_9AGAR|nr:hypothetical protein DXG03_005954 [Asterophora parasitica]